MTFFGDYFLDKKIIHCVGKCVNEKAFLLPIRIRTDFKETKCGLPINEMDYYGSGTLAPKIGLSFCKNCINK